MDVPLPKNNASTSTNKRSKYTVRLMAPFSMRCSHCGEFIYKGRKFNARKENVQERYLGTIRIFRFYIRCPRCSGEICYKTDPENHDYSCEKGAIRNFEPWKDNTSSDPTTTTNTNTITRTGTNMEDMNPMTLLERQTSTHQKELEMIEELQKIKDKNDRLEAMIDDDDSITTTSTSSSITSEQLIREDPIKYSLYEHHNPEDDRIIREAFQKQNSSSSSSSSIKRNAPLKTTTNISSPLLERMKKIIAKNK